MVCMFILAWSVPPITYMMRFLKNLPENALVKTAHVVQKPRFQFSTVLTKNSGFRFQFGNHHSTIVNTHLNKLIVTTGGCTTGNQTTRWQSNSWVSQIVD